MLCCLLFSDSDLAVSKLYIKPDHYECYEKFKMFANIHDPLGMFEDVLLVSDHSQYTTQKSF